MIGTQRVSAVLVRGLVEGLQHAGVSTEAFLREAKVDPQRVREAHGWFGLEEFEHLITTALRLTQDPAFGLHWGERSPMYQFDLATSLLALAPTLQHALRALEELRPSLISYEALSVIARGDRCVLRFNLDGSDSLAARALVELSAAGLVRALRYLGAGDALLRVCFSHRRPAYGAEYERIFGLVLFEQAAAGIEFTAEALDWQRPTSNAQTHHELLDQAKALRQRALAELGYAEQVAAQVRAALPRAITLAEAARVVGLSTRSLRRRLAEQGWSFSGLVDDVRRARAQELLARGTMSAEQIAYALGFETRGGYHRASRRWTESRE